ncbi:hypothetical protein A2671_01700 [Candidatus Kaiserbacteria bacterium RIFCSPHIGHO2_01_FULL_49_13]|uniref:FAD/NAD(P)-binding domain-containing protein n=1 Tax=Candidatus Kaiserbacteria bacterium RIFCSPHIGHO2_01_FULL_49_13 TaxID=1798477 RepID=A0A1F6CF49_9BACT|nr:MAG: hypothetical protein A2671_01700 [Candidatus Kaiserbacteria bacterium RIFCSPHIGHO2_01_FULL_49_13]
MYDLAIIGGGPGGVAAGVYASRKHLKTILITEDFGGQSVVSPEVQNWIGEVSISGPEFAKKLKTHLLAYAEGFVTVVENDSVTDLRAMTGGFSLTTKKGSYQAKTILITAGAARRRLKVPGADTFDQKGLTYCASCDGPLFSDMDVAVIGGGNAGFETAAQLLAYTKSVTLLHHGPEFKADPITVKKVLSNPKMHVIRNAEPIEVRGNTFVSTLVYEDKESGEKRELPVSGIFVEIGLVPNTAFAKNVTKLDPYGRIVVNPRTQQTSTPGIWAAGDVTDSRYHQNNISAGDAVKALEDIYNYLYMR